jgi:hypothetical protein
MTSDTSPTPSPIPPIVCDMTGAHDTAAERVAEYGHLFAAALVGRERTPTGIRFRFRRDPGVEDWVRDLAGREQACCAFFTFTISAVGHEVRWDASVPDDETARAVLDEMLALPDTVGAGPAAVLDRLDALGNVMVTGADGRLRPATPAELGLEPS